MVNNFLREYHVWTSADNPRRAFVVDTYYQEIISEHSTVKSAFEALRALDNKQTGTYPSIIEAS